MKILIACEESQEVCKAFREKGHDTFSCDILEPSGGYPEWHIQSDVLEVMDGSWDMMIAFPPCTDLAVSGAAWFKQKRNDGRQKKAVEFFMKIYNADCEKIVIENPVGIISGNYIKKYFPELCEKYGLPIKPTQIIQPYFFGDPANKKTCLWIKGVEPLKHDQKKYCEGSKYITATSGRRYPEWCWNTGGGCGGKRSKTFPGIAKAMAKQWGGNNENN